MNDIKLRVARPSDAAELLALYAPYVEDTAISFETVVPSLEEFTERMVHKLPRYPYIVAEKDGELLGYAYLSPFVGRAAYLWAAERANWWSSSLMVPPTAHRLLWQLVMT